MQAIKYKTIATSGTSMYRDRGSKFFGFAYPINHQEDIKPLLATLKKEHPKAVHHCYAWRIGIDGTQYRANDDGEPSGSAGRPILGQIDSLGLTNVLVVVVRYFGGTLLGVPGLINAYKVSTNDALVNLPTVEEWVKKTVTFSFDYPVMGEVLYLLRTHEATILQQEHLLFCTIKAAIPQHLAAVCTAKITEIRGVTSKEEV
jgi:uncharacterized YigZ family protein